MSIPTLPSVPTVMRSNGVVMPAIGLGTWPMSDDEAAAAVDRALRIGWRLVGTAENQGNVTGVGRGLHASGVDRSEIFVTSKFNRRWHSVEGVRAACEASLARLGLDYLDLLLVHWPNPDQDRYVEAVEGLFRVLDAGLVRAIGVSNVKPTHLVRLFERGLVPHVYQIQIDPQHRRDDVTALDRAKGIVIEAWSPVGRAGPGRSSPIPPWERSPRRMGARRPRSCCAGTSNTAGCRCRNRPTRFGRPRISRSSTSP